MRRIGTDGVALSLCQTVTAVSPAKCKQNAVWLVYSGGPKKPCINLGSVSGLVLVVGMRGAIFRVKRECPYMSNG